MLVGLHVQYNVNVCVYSTMSMCDVVCVGACLEEVLASSTHKGGTCDRQHRDSRQG